MGPRIGGSTFGTGGLWVSVNARQCSDRPDGGIECELAVLEVELSGLRHTHDLHGDL